MLLGGVLGGPVAIVAAAVVAAAVTPGMATAAAVLGVLCGTITAALAHVAASSIERGQPQAGFLSACDNHHIMGLLTSDRFEPRCTPVGDASTLTARDRIGCQTALWRGQVAATPLPRGHPLCPDKFMANHFHNTRAAMCCCLLVLGALAFDGAMASPVLASDRDAGGVPEAIHARVVQGAFGSKEAEHQLLHAMAEEFGREVQIGNPADDPRNGDGETGDRFGYSVALSGDTALVGAPYDFTPLPTGSVYVFTRTEAVWRLQGKLVPADGMSGDHFGSAVAVSGDVALVGAPRHDPSGQNDAGAVYVFVRSGAQWVPLTKLQGGSGAGPAFGHAVAISAATALVGAPQEMGGEGAVYAFSYSGSAWDLPVRLTVEAASGGAFGLSGGGFGSSVALSDDTALIGAPNATVAGSTGAGAAYTFTRTNGQWAQEARLTAADASAGDRFGHSVALVGGTALVGAPSDDTLTGTDAGSGYVFNRTVAGWQQQAHLLVGAAGADSRRLGSSVALSSDTALLGAPYHNREPSIDAGGVHLFQWDGTDWIAQGWLSAPDGSQSDLFGYSVAVSAETALSGAVFDDTVAGRDAGSAHVYTRLGTGWAPQAHLTAGKGAASDAFGVSVAIFRDTALIAAPEADTDAGEDAGSVYVFTRRAAVWSLEATLTAADAGPRQGFGESVALSGDTALVGTPYKDGFKGAAYVFLRSGGEWTQQAKLLASGTSTPSEFGTSVAILDDTALVGAPYADTASAIGAGAAYVFVRSGDGWTQSAKLELSEGRNADLFGWDVALDGRAALIGAPASEIGPVSAAGAAHLFADNGSIWTHLGTFTASDPGHYDQFGYSVALSDDSILIGAPWTDDEAAGLADVGSAYLFVRNGVGWIEERLVGIPQEETWGFGTSVAIVGDIAVVGTSNHLQAGSAHVFTHSANGWAARALLTADDGAAEDGFGSAAAVSDQVVLVGAPLAHSLLTGNPEVGAAYVYTHHLSVTATAVGQGSIAPDVQLVEPGASAEFDIRPAANHHLVSVTGDNCAPAALAGTVWSASDIQDSCAVVATFAPDEPDRLFRDGFEQRSQ